MPLFSAPARRATALQSDGRDGDAEVTTVAGRDRRPASYFFLRAVGLRFGAAFRFAAGFFFAAGFLFAGAFLAAGLRVVLANVLLLSMLSRESAHRLF